MRAACLTIFVGLFARGHCHCHRRGPQEPRGLCHRNYAAPAQRESRGASYIYSELILANFAMHAAHAAATEMSLNYACPAAWPQARPVTYSRRASRLCLTPAHPATGHRCARGSARKGCLGRRRRYGISGLPSRQCGVARLSSSAAIRATLNRVPLAGHYSCSGSGRNSCGSVHVR